MNICLKCYSVKRQPRSSVDDLINAPHYFFCHYLLLSVCFHPSVHLLFITLFGQNVSLRVKCHPIFLLDFPNAPFWKFPTMARITSKQIFHQSRLSVTEAAGCTSVSLQRVRKRLRPILDFHPVPPPIHHLAEEKSRLKVKARPNWRHPVQILTIKSTNMRNWKFKAQLQALTLSISS